MDDRTYVFTLRPDQYWQDGRAVTADDVLFTVGVLADPSLVDTPGLPVFWRNVKVEQVDDVNVRFKLPQPFAPFLDYTTIGLLPKHRYDGRLRGLVPRRQWPNWAGPMRVASSLPTIYVSNRARLRRQSALYLDLEFEFFPDYASVLAD